MAGLQAPLSTLRLAPRDALRMTRGQRGLLFLYCEDFHLLLFAQSPGALVVTCKSKRYYLVKAVV
jgi:hypothetical protein